MPDSNDPQTPLLPPPRWRLGAYRFRHGLLGLAVLLWAGAVGFCLYHDLDVLPLVIVLGVIVALQGLFLVGAPQLRWPVATRGVPMTLSLLTGALLAGLLTFGIVATLLNIGPAWKKIIGVIEAQVFWGIAVAWGAWFFVFAFMWAGQWIDLFNRMYRLLVAGTILELLITLPVDVFVRKRTSCYCEEGTFFAMVIGVTLGFWTFGPGLVLLYLTRRLQRRGYFSLCRRCHYDLRGLAADTKHCPECGLRMPF